MQKHKLALLISLIVIIVTLFFIGAKTGISLDKAQGFIENVGIFAPLVFILIYAIGPVFFIPITPMAVIGGILFGPIWGTVYTLIGVTLGASAAFLVSRYLVKDWVDQKTPSRIFIIQEKVKEQGWKFVAIARITPIFPFNVQNYAFGVTDIPFKTFFITTIFSMIPGSFIYVYLGYAGREALGQGAGAWIKIVIAVALLLVFGFMPAIVKKFKIIIKKKKEQNKTTATA